jgi:hypothetical protein
MEYYHEQLVVHADLVYRFAFCLTLALDTSIELVKRIFEKTASQLTGAAVNQEINTKGLLLAESWIAFQETKNKKSGVPSLALAKHAAKMFESLTLEARSALFLVDIAGLTVKDSAKTLGMQENQLRAHLGQGRKTLLNTSFEA